VVPLFELLDDHWDALKAREGEISELHRRMKELSAAMQATTEENGWLKEDLIRKVATRLSREEEGMQLMREPEKKGQRC